MVPFDVFNGACARSVGKDCKFECERCNFDWLNNGLTCYICYIVHYGGLHCVLHELRVK